MEVVSVTLFCSKFGYFFSRTGIRHSTSANLPDLVQIRERGRRILIIILGDVGFFRPFYSMGWLIIRMFFILLFEREWG